MRAINLNRELPCEYLCHQIQLLINDYKTTNPDVKECLLIMDIQQITDYNNIPRLTETPLPLS